LLVASGRLVTLDYSGDSPVLAVKLQELFGTSATPAVLEGRLPVTVHLLSPAGRPAAITQDLAGFWQRGYAEVRRDLRGRYPKHPWPDDPARAVATAHTKARMARPG
jgi:ATP-dependent helicase HrpB